MVACIGFPDRYLDEVITTVMDLLLHAGYESPQYFLANTAGEFLRASLNSLPNTRVLACHCPDQAMIEALAESGTPVIMPSQSYLEKAAEFAQTEDIIQSIRITQRYASSFLYAAEMTRCLELPISMSSGDLRAHIAGHLDLAADVMAIESGHSSGISSYFSNMSSADQLLLKVNLTGQEQMRRQSSKQVFNVSRDLFFLGPDIDMASNGRIDLTGRAGIITYGPYLSLPPGKWRVRYIFSAAPNVMEAQMHFIVQTIGNGANLEVASVDYTLTRPGRQEVEMTFEITHVETVTEVHFSKIKPMFEGDIIVGYVSFERILSLQENTADWNDVLLVPEQ